MKLSPLTGYMRPRLATRMPILGLLLGGFIVSGCGTDTQSIRDTVESVVQSRQTSFSSIDDDQSSVSESSTGFTLPYPDRKNPFAYPGEAAEEVTANFSRDVAVLGFSNVNEPRVVLQIGDRTFVPAEGDVIAGITIKSIRAPQVDLQRGDFVWTAGMFDKQQ